ncbi:hypothetical protein [Marinomonas algarum]|uniref:Uncharacterized protein n=1 Tax=Marinomonas algarum TaxID=2883105 RepID=A0A9X1IQU2_9GAMM|nr:hypothetical protein [Marinomonas algarum]MCB5162526.1 hypothetical protein [Marinomonas algarum]
MIGWSRSQIKSARLSHITDLIACSLEKVSLQDIAQIPVSHQHIVVEKIESLQDELKQLMVNQTGVIH